MTVGALIVIVLLVCLAVWLLQKYIPEPAKTWVTVVIVIGIVVLLLQLAGLWSMPIFGRR